MPESPTGAALVNLIPELEAAELVSTGGQKKVYKAEIHGQSAALKLIALPPEEVNDEHDVIDIDVAVQRARREVAILDQVDIPVLARSGALGLNTIEIEGNRWLYFSEEWIDGKTLRDMIRSERLPPEQVAKLGIDLINAVCWLSDRGLVHRDIKPANIMLHRRESNYVLLDTGIALDLHGPSLTQIPVTVGTTAYLSPEQMDPFRKRELDFRSDLFAVGVVMYEAATGEHPFRIFGETITKVLSGILHGTPKPVEVKVENFPSDLGNFIIRLLGKAPHMRFRKCELALSAIMETAASTGVKE